MRSCFVFTRVVESGVPLAPGAVAVIVTSSASSRKSSQW